MSVSRTSARPVKLPQAPDRYDKTDIDRTRRMIEQALAQYGLGIAGLAGAVGRTTTDPMKLFVPVSPIHGVARGLGSATNSGFVQLLNPATSNKLVVIWRAAYNYESALTPAACNFRVTDFPSTVSVLTTAALAHMNGNDLTAITSTLVGGTLSALAAEFSVLGSEFVINTPAKVTSTLSMQQRELTQDGGEPIILLPGQALEGMNGRKATDSDMQLYVEFDEVALTEVIGEAQPETGGFTYPRSSIVGSCSTGGLALSSVSGALSVIQLYNPGPKFIDVTGLYVLGNQVGAANAVKARRTSSPLVLGGAVITLTPKRMDHRSTVAVQGQLKFSNNPGTVIFGPTFWEGKVGAADPRLPWHAKIIKPFSRPLRIKPGSALEIGGLANVSSQNGYPLNVLMYWDEVDQ